MDITKPLPFGNASIDFILCEHCMEHVYYREAIEFLKECRRILIPQGILRLIVPSLEKIRYCSDKDYFKFTQKWQSTGQNVRGAMDAIIYAHGHKAIWSESLLESVLFFCGFERTAACAPGRSSHSELENVDGHAKSIGVKFNAIESLILEAS